MSKLFGHINKYPDEIYIVKLKNGTTFEGTAFTCYETENGLDEDEKGYEEYYACAMQIEKIISKGEDENLEEGQLIEINYHNYPVSIKTKAGEKI